MPSHQPCHTQVFLMYYPGKLLMIQNVSEETGRIANKKKVAVTKARTAANEEALSNKSDKNNGELECICGLCCEPVKDKEDKGLYCEGACAQWFHCYCTRVTVPQFKRLSNSSSPLPCMLSGKAQS